jgi:glycosyl hydrolase family 113
VGSGDPITEAQMRLLAAQHVDWISQTPFGWQRKLDSTQIAVASQDRVMWGESDRGLAATARLAREHGIRTLLKPHVWVVAGHGAWTGEIAMTSEEAWREWFASYRDFLLHYARLAQAEGFDALCVGTELQGTTLSREADWRRLIAEVRSIYRGKLTYAANWNREFDRIAFWDALDFVGIQAYFPLAERDGPTLAELEDGWAPHLAAIERVHRATGKPIVFTEIGYKSVPESAMRPWEWPGRNPDAGARSDLATQARAYEAFFRTFWERPWFAGVYFWKWYPEAARSEGPYALDFTPQNKPAQEVMSSWFGGTPPLPVKRTPPRP